MNINLNKKIEKYKDLKIYKLVVYNHKIKLSIKAVSLWNINISIFK